MKVIDNRKTDKKVKFEDLPVGEGYLDENDYLCIKTSHHDDGENCICFTNGSWSADYQSDTDWITPIKLTYTIEG
jgi:hypothetical protein